MIKDLHQEVEEMMWRNYEACGRKATSPSCVYYAGKQWLWDSCAHAIIWATLARIYARLGQIDRAKKMMEIAKNEIRQLLRYQMEDGCIPQKIYHNTPLRWYDFERRLSKNKHRETHSSTTQTPIIAQAVEFIGDPEFTKEVFPKLEKFYTYLIEKRDPDKDGIISICDPFEGRDNSREYDFFYRKMKRLKFLNPFLIGYSNLKLKERYKKLDWDIEKIWEADLFNVEDLMFHCLFVDGMRSLRNLAELLGYREKAKIWEERANRHEDPVYKLCYDEEDKIFYSLDSKNQKIKRKTIASLFPIILENIPSEMLKALIEHLTNPDEFWTNYPIPTLAKSDPDFKADQILLTWGGPGAMITNFFIGKGLVRHGYLDIAQYIFDQNKGTVRQGLSKNCLNFLGLYYFFRHFRFLKKGFPEFFNPLTGQGLRVPNYGWDGLVIAFDEIIGQGK